MINERDFSSSYYQDHDITNYATGPFGGGSNTFSNNRYLQAKILFSATGGVLLFRISGSFSSSPFPFTDRLSVFSKLK
jgi:hypothetical protein